MSEKAHWMPWYCREWLVDTRHLSCEARGAYHDLLNHQWLDGGLVNDQDELQRRAGAKDAEWKRVWPKVKGFLPLDGDGMRRNGKLERIRAKHLGKARNGAKGGTANASEHASKPPSEHASKQGSKLPANMPALEFRGQTSEGTAVVPSLNNSSSVHGTRHQPTAIKEIVGDWAQQNRMPSGDAA